MCYQKFHVCKYCKSPYECDVDNALCPTINHDADMDMCDVCKKKLEDKLKEIDLDEIEIQDINLKDLIGDN